MSLFPLIPFEEWLRTTPVVRDDASLSPKVWSRSEFVEFCRLRNSLIVLEGPRYVGKTFAADALKSEAGKLVYTAGKSIRERKSLIDDFRQDRRLHRTGSADYEDFALSVAQAHLWVLDSVQQLCEPVLDQIVFDRCLLSSLWFQGGVCLPHWQEWVRQTQRLRILVVYLQLPSFPEHHARCQERGKSWLALQREIVGYRQIFRRIPEAIEVLPLQIT